MHRTGISCPTCRFEARSACVLNAHTLDAHGSAPDRDPRLGDPVYAREDYRQYCVPACANFKNGSAHAQARLLRAAA